MSKFMNKFRNESARRAGWDYSSAGKYFITICTKPRLDVFGHVLEGKVVLSEMGRIAEECWQAIPAHYVIAGLGVYVIMPDHFHGILIIRSGNMTVGHIGTVTGTIGTGTDGMGHGDGMGHAVGTGHAVGMGHAVGTGHAPSLPATRHAVGNIVGSFKSAVTKKIHETGIGHFGWQDRFNDRIIRNENELSRIERYIIENPAKWNRTKNQ